MIDNEVVALDVALEISDLKNCPGVKPCKALADKAMVEVPAVVAKVEVAA